jgi:hypothetical protein
MGRIVSTVLLTAVPSLAAATPAAQTCGPPAAGWEHSRGDRVSPVNTVVLYDHGHHRPTWNGATVTTDQIREYLGVTTQMSPQPVFVQIISPNADCHEVDAYRRMASEVLKCGSHPCVEVSP